jgi:hypothetical protein
MCMRWQGGIQRCVSAEDEGEDWEECAVNYQSALVGHY